MEFDPQTYSYGAVAGLSLLFGLYMGRLDERLTRKGRQKPPKGRCDWCGKIHCMP
jgi:hypothetical protein